MSSNLAINSTDISMAGRVGGGEASMPETRKQCPTTTGDLVVVVSNDKEDARKLNNGGVTDGGSNAQPIGNRWPSSPEIYRSTPSPSSKPPRPPKPDAITPKVSFSRSTLSKPKSRFGEQPVDPRQFEESGGGGAVKQERASAPITPKTPFTASPDGGRRTEEGMEEMIRIVNTRLDEKRRRRVKAKVVVDWGLSFLILGCLASSVYFDRLHGCMVWGLELWKWFLMVWVVFSGMLFTKWLVHILVFVIERNFLLRKKVLYFVHGLKKSVRVVTWLGLVLLAWVLLFNNGVRRSRSAAKVLDFITWTLVSLLVGSFLWLLKTFSLKLLASNFHLNAFFDRIQESIFMQYVLQTLSGPPVEEMGEGLSTGGRGSSGRVSFSRVKSKEEGVEKKVIEMGALQNMRREKVSAWTMKLLIDVANKGLTTISSTLDESMYEEEGKWDKEITSEMEAMTAAYQIFWNVAQPGNKQIEEEDLKRFLCKDDTDRVLSLFQTKQIGIKIFREWVVSVHKSRQALAHALNDTKTAVKQLNKLVSGIVIVVIIVVWLLLVEIATTKVLLFLSSQLIVAVFMFGNTCKTIFECIVFVFVTHPFDVGDRCVVDGTQMVVEEMNILTTVFLKFDNEKIYYPNSVLSTKPISNYFRSPDMGDSVELSLHFSTTVEKMGSLKERVQRYLEANPQRWHPDHNVVVKEIENVNKIKIVIFINHTMNFQNVGEKSRRRSDFVLELKKILEEEDIRYHLLPQELHLTSLTPAALRLLTSNNKS